MGQGGWRGGSGTQDPPPPPPAQDPALEKVGVRLTCTCPVKLILLALNLSLGKFPLLRRALQQDVVETLQLQSLQSGSHRKQDTRVTITFVVECDREQDMRVTMHLLGCDREQDMRATMHFVGCDKEQDMRVTMQLVARDREQDM